MGACLRSSRKAGRAAQVDICVSPVGTSHVRGGISCGLKNEGGGGAAGATGPHVCGSVLVGEAAHGFLTLNGNGSGPPSSRCAHPGHGQRSINERSEVTSPHPRERMFLALCAIVGAQAGIRAWQEMEVARLA